MIFGIGTDLLEKKRAIHAFQKLSFQEKHFSEKECSLIRERESRIASNFAGKEAVVKAFGTGFRGDIRPKDIQILRNEWGRPYVELQGGALEFATVHNITQIHISISDTQELVTAYVIVEWEEGV